MIVIDPRMMSFELWSAMMVHLLSSYGVVSDHRAGASWRAWGEEVIGLPQIAALLPPHPEGFSDWQAWAHELNRSLDLLVR